MQTQTIRIPEAVVHPQFDSQRLTFFQFCELVIDQIPELSATLSAARKGMRFLDSIDCGCDTAEVPKDLFDIVARNVTDDKKEIASPSLMLDKKVYPYGRALRPFLAVFEPAAEAKAAE